MPFLLHSSMPLFIPRHYLPSFSLLALIHDSFFAPSLVPYFLVAVLPVFYYVPRSLVLLILVV